MMHKKYFAIAVVVLLAMIMTGCLKPQVLDGDGMERRVYWNEFTVGQSSDVYEENIFYTVVRNEEDFSFYVYDADSDDGKLLHKDTVDSLLAMDLVNFSDKAPVAESPDNEDLFMIDGISRSLTVIDEFGYFYNKNISRKEAEQIFALLAPYFD